jgi:hypothetical protein
MYAQGRVYLKYLSESKLFEKPARTKFVSVSIAIA